MLADRLGVVEAVQVHIKVLPGQPLAVVLGLGQRRLLERESFRSLVVYYDVDPM